MRPGAEAPNEKEHTTMILSLNGLLANHSGFTTTIAGFEHTLKQLQTLQHPEGKRGRGAGLTSTG